MRGRRLLDRRGALFLAALALLTPVLFFLFSRLPGGAVAVVEVNGRVVRRVELSQLQAPLEEEILGENGIHLQVVFFPDGAQVLSSQCPDKVCVHFGKLTRAGEEAVCLPAKVVLRLEGGGDTAAPADAMTG